MKYLLICVLFAMFSCKSTKTTAAEEPAPEGSRVIADSLPVCVKTLIEKFKTEAVTNPPRKIYSYMYGGKKVFYVPAICCDFFSDLYNDSCRIMGHPDGGFTGKGDGKIRDFEIGKKDEKLLWEDTRGK